jgi:hypothetical protein
MEEKKYFFCYSLRLKLFLKSIGFRYEIGGNNNKTDKPYWAYLRSEELSDALSKWRNINNYP